MGSAALLAALTLQATLAPWFGDHMVLQCDRPLPVCGTAAPGERVEVRFRGAVATAVTEPTGRWRVTLPPQSASAEPATLVAGEQTVSDVLTGEVWLCAGQSNMEFPLGRAADAAVAVPAATVPNLRLFNAHYAGQGVSGQRFTAGQLADLTPERFYRGQWQSSTPASARDFSAIGYFAGRELVEQLRVPVGLLNLAVGGSPTEAWLRPEALPTELTTGRWLDNPRLGPWCRERGRQNLGTAAADAHAFQPGFLWRCGPGRLTPFALRGVWWYQGESNSLEDWRVTQHETLFPALVADWRAQWADPELWFLCCQLSSIGTERGYQSQHWPEFRDSQRRLVDRLTHAGLVVTSDLGHRSDVHPRAKHAVGQRLAQLALARVYGRPVPWSGPTLRSVALVEGRLVATFDHAGDGLRTSDGQPPREFEVQTDDGTWQAVVPRLAGDRAVFAVGGRAVRYGWRPFSEGNLVGEGGLPASTCLTTRDR